VVAQSCGQATAIREAQRDKTPEFGRPEPLIPSKSALLRSAISSPEGETLPFRRFFRKLLKTQPAAGEWPNGTEWMRGQQERTGPLFFYISTEDRIPKGHPLRQVRQLADQALDRLNPTFCRLYPEGGRPSIPPEQLLLALLLQAIYGIRSERMLIEQLDYNLLFRWFVGLNPDDPVWHLPRSGSAFAGGAAPKRSAASGGPWSWRCQSLQPKSEHSSGCCRREAWSAGPG